MTDNIESNKVRHTRISVKKHIKKICAIFLPTKDVKFHSIKSNILTLKICGKLHSINLDNVKYIYNSTWGFNFDNIFISYHPDDICRSSMYGKDFNDITMFDDNTAKYIRFIETYGDDDLYIVSNDRYYTELTGTFSINVMDFQ